MNDSSRPAFGLRSALLCLAFILVIATLLGVWQREWIQARAISHSFRTADEVEGFALAERLAKLGTPGRQVLLDTFVNDSQPVQRSALYGFSLWALKAEQTEITSLLGSIQANYHEFCLEGKVSALELLRILSQQADPAHPAFRAISEQAMQEATGEIKLRAIAVAMKAELQILDVIAPLLADTDSRVRRAALLAVGPVIDGKEPIVTTEDLLPMLHDSDPQLVKLCKQVLRGRGVPQRDIDLSWKLTHPDTMERLRLLMELPALARDDDFDPTPWVVQLSLDRDAAVRAGAARVAGEQKLRMIDRIQAMKNDDPDATVRDLAKYYEAKMHGE
jgi:HEAT repeat protein